MKENERKPTKIMKESEDEIIKLKENMIILIVNIENDQKTGERSNVVMKENVEENINNENIE